MTTSSALSRLSNLHAHLQPSDSNSKIGGLLKVSPEVSQALSSGHAVVALESTIISHDANMNLRLRNGILIAVPILKEPSALGNVIKSAIEKALREARDEYYRQC